MDEHVDKILLTAGEIDLRVSELAKMITDDYRGKELLLVGILRGAIIFVGDLVRKIEIPLEMDFMAVSSYGSSTKTSGVVRILKDLDVDIKGKDVLIVEDIIDSGLTLKYLIRNLHLRNPASLKICTLLRKDVERKALIDIDYCGFEVENKFIIGYGLDFNEKYRNLRDIHLLKFDPRI